MNKIRFSTSDLPLLTWKGNGEMKSFPVTEWTLTQELWTIHTVCSISATATHYQRYVYVSITSDCHVNQLILTSRVLFWELEVLKFEYHLSCFEEQQSYTIRPANKTRIRQVCVNGFKCIWAIIKRPAWNGDNLISEWCFLSEKVGHLLHLAVDSEGLVHIRGLGTTALAPNNHGSRTVELLFKLHIFLPDPHAAFPELPPFLETKIHHVLLRWYKPRVFWFPKIRLQSHPVPLLQADFLQGPHQTGGTVRRPELGRGLELSQLQVEGVRMVPAVFASERDKRLQFPGCDHRGCLFIHDFRHESQISALFLPKKKKVNTGAVRQMLN